MFFTRPLLSTALVAAFLPILAGCGPTAPAPEPETTPTAQEASEAVAPEATAPKAPAPTPGAPAEETATPESPDGAKSEADPTDQVPLPEITALNTAQFRGVMEKTKGKVTVLNLWATWCGPCIHETPDLVKFYNETDRETLNFVSLSFDDVPEVEGAIPEFLRTHKVTFPVFVLNDRNDEELFRALRTQFGGGIPTTYVYDKEGALVKSVDGAIGLEELRKIVVPLLASDTVTDSTATP